MNLLFTLLARVLRNVAILLKPGACKSIIPKNILLNQHFAPYYHANGLVPAYVAVEDKLFFRVWTANSELHAQVSGKCTREAPRSNSKSPKVGDWVAVKLVPNEEKTVIQAILPRRTRLSRKMIDRSCPLDSPRAEYPSKVVQ